MELNDEEKKILVELLKEYELRAKYNNDVRDYRTYSVLEKVVRNVI